MEKLTRESFLRSRALLDRLVKHGRSEMRSRIRAGSDQPASHHFVSSPAHVGLGLCLFLRVYGINTLSFASPAIMRFWHVPVNSIAELVSATFMGMFVGSAAGGWVSDRFGRKRALLYTTLWYTGFSLLNALAWNITSLFIFRLLTGVGISAMIVIGITYISELFPAPVRGTYQGWIMAIGLCGVPITAYVARFCIPLASWGWRLVFVWGSLGLIFPFFVGVLEESPRWYEDHDQFDQADAALDRIESQIKLEVGRLPDPVETQGVRPVTRTRFSEVFISPHLRRTVLLVIAWIFGSLGFFGFTSWVPTLLVARGVSSSPLAFLVLGNRHGMHSRGNFGGSRVRQI